MCEVCLCVGRRFAILTERRRSGRQVFPPAQTGLTVSAAVRPMVSSISPAPLSEGGDSDTDTLGPRDMRLPARAGSAWPTRIGARLPEEGRRFPGHARGLSNVWEKISGADAISTTGSNALVRSRGRRAECGGSRRRASSYWIKPPKPNYASDRATPCSCPASSHGTQSITRRRRRSPNAPDRARKTPVRSSRPPASRSPCRASRVFITTAQVPGDDKVYQTDFRGSPARATVIAPPDGSAISRITLTAIRLPSRLHDPMRRHASAHAGAEQRLSGRQPSLGGACWAIRLTTSQMEAQTRECRAHDSP